MAVKKKHCKSLFKRIEGRVILSISVGVKKKRKKKKEQNERKEFDGARMCRPQFSTLPTLGYFPAFIATFTENAFKNIKKKSRGAYRKRATAFTYAHVLVPRNTLPSAILQISHASFAFS